MNKVLLDTNVLIYSIDEESKYFEKSHTILSDINLQLFTTSKNISEFLAVITRIPDRSLSIQQALIVVRDFQNIFTFLYLTEHSYRVFIDLIKKYKPVGTRIHDFEIASIAIENHIMDIATFNAKDFSGVEEVNVYLP